MKGFKVEVRAIPRRKNTTCSFCMCPKFVRDVKKEESTQLKTLIKSCCSYITLANIRIPLQCNVEVLPFCNRCIRLLRRFSESLSSFQGQVGGGGAPLAEEIYRQIEDTVAQGQARQHSALFRNDEMIDDMEDVKWTGLRDKIWEGFIQKPNAMAQVQAKIVELGVPPQQAESIVKRIPKLGTSGNGTSNRRPPAARRSTKKVSSRVTRGTIPSAAAGKASTTVEAVADPAHISATEVKPVVPYLQGRSLSSIPAAVGAAGDSSVTEAPPLLLPIASVEREAMDDGKSPPKLSPISPLARRFQDHNHTAVPARDPAPGPTHVYGRLNPSKLQQDSPVELTLPGGVSVPPFAERKRPLDKRAHDAYKKMRKFVPQMPGTDYNLPLALPCSALFREVDNKLFYKCPVCSVEETDEDCSDNTICCEFCEAWFHWSCVGIESDPGEEIPWYCKRCVCEISEEPHKEFPMLFN